MAKKVDNIPKRTKVIAVILGLLILASGIYQTFFGETEVGILIIISFIAIMIPGIYTRNSIKKFPIEIEILLFAMVMLQLVLGEARDFYTNVPYYDKFVHYILPLFLGLIGFLIFFTLRLAGKLQTTIFSMMFIIIFITLGLGAAWEIMEYSSDRLLYPNVEGWHHFQGNAEQNPLDDTMTDLINDTLGAVFGALIGLWYFRNAQADRKSRKAGLLKEVSETLTPLA